MNDTKAPENRAYKVTLILLLGLAAFSTAMRELNNLYEMVASVQQFTREWRGSDLATVNEKPISLEEFCPNDSRSLINSSAQSDLSGLIAAATDGEVERMEYEAITEPEVGAKVDLIAGRHVNRNTPPRAKYAPQKNLKEEMASLFQNKNWPARIEYKSPEQNVTLELPMTMVRDIKAGDFENVVSPQVLSALLGKINRTQAHGKVETLRRELIIKRLERSISSRRAS